MVSLTRRLLIGTLVVLGLAGCATTQADLEACVTLAERGLRPIAEERTQRFLGKVQNFTAQCRGGDKAVALRSQPWVDWANYWATGDASTKPAEPGSKERHLSPTGRGIDGALLDLEYQRIELIKFNLFDNTGTYKDYLQGRNGVSGPAVKTWEERRLPKGHPDYDAVGGDGTQVCQSDLVRFRTLTGICNDIKNPRWVHRTSPSPAMSNSKPPSRSSRRS